MKKKNIIMIIVFAVSIMFYITADATESGWRVQIIDEEDNQVVIDNEDFMQTFRSYLDFQVFMQGPVEEDIDEIVTDCEKQNEYLQNYVSETLIIHKATERGYYNEESLQEQLTIFNLILERMYLLRLYAENVVKPQIEVSSEEIGARWQDTESRLSESNPDITGEQIEEYIIAKITEEKMQVRMEEIVQEYRNNNFIRYNEAFDIPDDQEPDPEADTSWRVRIRDVESGEVILITPDEFDSAYRGYLDFQLFLTSQMQIINTQEYLDMLENQTQRDLYLGVYVDETILVLLARQAEEVDTALVDEKIASFGLLLRRMLIIQAYTNEYINPMISVTDEEIEQVYEERRTAIEDILEQGDASEEEILDYIRTAVRSEKTMIKLQEMMQRYVGEYIIRYNEEFECE